MLLQVVTLLGVVGLQCSATAVPGAAVSIKTEHPGFITLARNSSTPGTPTWNIIISRFNGFPFSSDYVSVVKDIGDKKSHQVEDISSSLSWPNEPGSIPDNVFQRNNMIIIPSGFLVPTKGKGALTIYDLNDQSYTPYQVTGDADGDWFYHRAVWLDMDGDGKDDIVTCRAQKPFFGNTKGEMLWLKQPDGKDPWKSKWQQTMLVQGDGSPDTFLIPVSLTQGGKKIQTIITAGFFSKSLDIWWRKKESQPWSNTNLNKRVIDNSEGAVFDLIYADLNNDSKPELLVTYNKASNGTAFVYEFPSGDPRNGTAKKHLILSGIDPAKSGVGKGAPGGIKLAWSDPRKNDSSPDIILSGDDNGKLYLLRPKPAANWSYDSYVILDASPGTMGAIAVGDIDNDNYTDIIAPSYNEGTITILTYNPASISPTSKPPTPKNKNHNVFHRLYDWIKSLFS